MSKIKSEGKCTYCKKMYANAGMTRHLATHLKTIEKEKSTDKKAYHVKVNADVMFLHLLVSEKSTLKKLDRFLRAIWLECCGHMSSFEIKGKEYDFGWDSNEMGESMKQTVGKVFQKDMELRYQYDFGSTTELEVKVLNEYHVDIEKKGIELLSRNEPLELGCHSCGKNGAVTICSVCMFAGPSMFCSACAKKHRKTCSDFEDYSEMPVVNSPRMGICAYDGGQIDKARDGIFKEKKA